MQSYGIYFVFSTDESATESVLKCEEAYISLCGRLEMSVPRDAFITALCKASLPPHYALTVLNTHGNVAQKGWYIISSPLKICFLLSFYFFKFLKFFIAWGWSWAHTPCLPITLTKKERQFLPQNSVCSVSPKPLAGWNGRQSSCHSDCLVQIICNQILWT